MTKEKFIIIIQTIAKEIFAKKNFLTNLDNKIGDGDHGLNMERGFQEVLHAIEHINPKSIKDILLIIGKTLMSKVGGASGPLYGMLFIKGAMTLSTNDIFNYETMKQFIDEATKAIRILGKAKLDDKTMYDVWKRASNDFNLNIEKNQIILNLKINMKHTKNLIAKKGRAYYLGERSKGTIDPGAVSSEIILRNLIGGI